MLDDRCRERGRGFLAFVVTCRAYVRVRHVCLEEEFSFGQGRPRWRKHRQLLPTLRCCHVFDILVFCYLQLQNRKAVSHLNLSQNNKTRANPNPR